MCVNCGVSSCSSCNTNSYIPDSTSALKYDGPKFVCPTDFTVLPGASLNDMMNTLMEQICTNSSGGGGQVDSVVAGTNVTVDNTDPINPIINASGGGGTVTSLTTTGTSGPSTLGGGVLNIPEYAGVGFDGVFTDVDMSALVTFGGSATVNSISSFGLSYYIAGKTAFIGFRGSLNITGSIGDTINITNMDLSSILTSNIDSNSFNRFSTGSMSDLFGTYNPIALPLSGNNTDIASGLVKLPIAMSNDLQAFYGQMTLSIV